MQKYRVPCIVGVAHEAWRPLAGDALHPLLLAARLARSAAFDASPVHGLRQVDELDVVLPLSWPYANVCESLASELGLRRCALRLSGLSGTSPQRFVNEAAESIGRGERKAVLICGAESFATLEHGRQQGRRLGWPRTVRTRAVARGQEALPTERKHKVVHAATALAMLDSARRAHMGVSLAEHRGLQERPFPRREGLDMGAAVLVMSDAFADGLGVSRDKRVYLHGWSHAEDHPHIAQRAELWRSAALERAAADTLAMAQKGIDDIEYFDLDASFPGSLSFSKDALGIADRDARALHVTSGLANAGDSGINYTTHAIAMMVEKLRRNRGAYGLVNGVGGAMTDLAFGLYSTSKPPRLEQRTHERPETAAFVIDDRAVGAAKILAYTVLRELDQTSAVAVCELPSGHRCYARATDAGLVRAMESEEWVGRAVHLTSATGINTFGSL